MRLRKIPLATMALGGCLLLTACGGGSGGSGSALTVQGTAAIGKPLAAPLSVTCKEGSGSSTSNSDGSFAVVINNGVGPCLLSMTTAAGTKLNSITSGAASTQTANLTPMTTLLVDYLRNVPSMSAPSPDAWFAKRETKALLGNTDALQIRITTDFIPAVKALVPPGTTLGLTDAGFLQTPFIPNPVISATDADLEKLIVSGFVTQLGVLIRDFVDKLVKAALNDLPVDPVTGASGASS